METLFNSGACFKVEAFLKLLKEKRTRSELYCCILVLRNVYNIFFDFTYDIFTYKETYKKTRFQEGFTLFFHLSVLDCYLCRYFASGGKVIGSRETLLWKLSNNLIDHL